eukprot:136111-Chlamydomonas_euryale.AAC.1
MLRSKPPAHIDPEREPHTASWPLAACIQQPARAGAVPFPQAWVYARSSRPPFFFARSIWYIRPSVRSPGLCI